MPTSMPTKRFIAGWSGLAKRYNRNPRTPKRWAEQGLLPPPDAVRNRVPYWSEETMDAHDRQSVAEAMSRRSDPATLSQPRRVRQPTTPTLKRTTASGPAASRKEKMT
jgi:hypothetical protein